MRAELEQEQANARVYAFEKEEVEVKMRKVETNLDNARKKLLSLQPPQDISDDQVKQAFNDLCQNIEDWVDAECQDLSSIEELISANGWSDTEMRITERHITEDDIKLSEEFPNIRSNIVMNAIFSFVYGCCFEETRWGGYVEAKEEVFLNGLIEVMSMQKSAYSVPIGPEFRSGLKFANNPHLRRWRSETFQAVQNDKSRVGTRAKTLKGSVHGLFSMLKHFADKKHRVQSERIRNKIIEPAYALADLIKASTSGYKFDFMVNSSSLGTYLQAEDVTLYRLVDAQTGIEEIVEKHEGILGRLRLCVFPGLQKVQDGGERSCLSQGMVVLDKSSGLEEKPAATEPDTTNNVNKDEETAVNPITPEKPASHVEEEQEHSSDVPIATTGKVITQTSIILEEQALKHHYSWTDIPSKSQAGIVW